ncbi:type-X family DNA polymerase [Aspergillus stella-maris]|uniref:type-X family DNA polymerase n=1 Tax=Aspergillus stella-maris TaxID=1810926 RepID=UPI003CCCEF4D
MSSTTATLPGSLTPSPTPSADTAAHTDAIPKNTKSNVKQILDLSTLPPIFILPTHLTLEALHEAEDTLIEYGARLTYDVGEAGLILGKVGQKKRAALELRSRGIWTEEVTAPEAEKDKEKKESVSAEPPAKRRRVDGDAVEDVYLGTENESEFDRVRGEVPTAKLEHPASAKKRGAPSVEELLGPAEEGAVRVVRLAWLDKCVGAQTAVSVGPDMVYCARKIERPATRSDKDTANSQAILDRAKQDAAFQAPFPPSRNRHDDSQSSSQRAPPKLYRQTTSENDEAEPLPPPPDWVRNNVLYSCMRSAHLNSPNEQFINQLVKIRTIRELQLDEIGVRAYSTAIASIAAYPYEIRRGSQIIALPGCDHKIAHLFTELKASDSGTLSAADALDTDPDLLTLHTFYNIWGVGSKTARDFYYARQWRDLDDIVEHGWSSLSRVQQIGVKYYDEFLLPIPRSDVEEIGKTICHHASKVRPNSDYDVHGVECIIVGSYRRGKPSSHDVDIILSHRDESITHNLVIDVVASLEEEGYITHTLSLHLTTSNRDQQTLSYRGDAAGTGEKHFDSLDKALVVWQCPHQNPKEKNTNPHRRVDIIISPWRTVGCAVLGWSGDTTFERDLRRYAKKSRGWKFDSSGVRERTSGGQVIDLERGGETWQERERLVMEGLGVGYRPPGERCTR